jgi:Resolvase, N terminal domain
LEQFARTKYTQYLGWLDALGILNSWWHVPEFRPLTHHSTNTFIPLSMRVADTVSRVVTTTGRWSPTKNGLSRLLACAMLLPSGPANTRGLCRMRIVVYKVDRLTRSLADFAKLVELFDGHGVSFVSVTQQFNTTTSMGRLTLNVLLSFAQFEREVTSERIRDKIAASKRKGLWVGGMVPLGYETKDRKIVVVEDEAERVRIIFRRYLELGSLNLLMADLRDRRIVTKVRSLSSGRAIGGIPFTRGPLAHHAALRAD